MYLRDVRSSCGEIGRMYFIFQRAWCLYRPGVAFCKLMNLGKIVEFGGGILERVKDDSKITISCWGCGHTVTLRKSRVDIAHYYTCNRNGMDCESKLPTRPEGHRRRVIYNAAAAFRGYFDYVPSEEEIEQIKMLDQMAEALLAADEPNLPEKKHPDVEDNIDRPLIRGYVGRYYCQAELLRRGWTRDLIGAVLGHPDAFAINMHHMSGPKVKLWKIERVQEAEGGTTKQ
jgi:hypothetical protein